MIKVDELTKRFGATLAVDRLSFEVKPGVVTGFLGPNGAGKSTTMRAVIGLDRPTSGSATVGGRAYRDHPAPVREVGALLEARAGIGSLSPRSHLRWLARAGGVSRKRVAEVLELVGLSDVAHRRISGLSLGMSQRLGLATALLGDPPTLVLDEPVNGLDPEGIRWVRTLLRQLAAEGRTVLVSSHLMSEMNQTADHVLVIGRGRLVADATVAELTKAGAGSRVRVVSPDAGALTDVLTAAGMQVSGENPGSGGQLDGSQAIDRPAGDGALLVAGADTATVAELAAAHGLRVHELSLLGTSLEAAHLALTQDSVEYSGANRSEGAGS